MMAFEASEMLLPVLILLGCHLGMFELKLQVFEITVKRRPGQAFDVFKHERFRPCLPHGSDSLREHVTRVIIGSVASAQREWLAWRASGNQVETSLLILEVHMTYIALDYPPGLRLRFLNGKNAMVVPERVTAPLVVFDHHPRLEARLGQTDSEASRARKQLYGGAFFFLLAHAYPCFVFEEIKPEMTQGYKNILTT
jgi:hypothetical protein